VVPIVVTLFVWNFDGHEWRLLRHRRLGRPGCVVGAPRRPRADLALGPRLRARGAGTSPRADGVALVGTVLDVLADS
jgi:hypothetical protein